MAYYIALIHKEPGSGYSISFPDIPGVTAVANMLDEAMRKASVALDFAFENWSGAFPRPRTLDALRLDPEFLDHSADAVVAAVTPAPGMADAA